MTTLDYNRDEWTDIYVAVDSQASILFHNNGDGTFEDVGIFAGVSFDDNGKVQAGMGSAAGDLDGDGKLDLIKTNFIEETSNIYVNNGDESFTAGVYSQGAGVSMEHMGWGVGFLDFDRDTWTDLVVANGHAHPEMEALVPNNATINGGCFTAISVGRSSKMSAGQRARG